ncbi:MAG: hypothetical protein HYZ14_00405 [Bacteroidetes bacterium]|nr:hypothetical protein [Bacteroidota bacterium]
MENVDTDQENGGRKESKVTRNILLSIVGILAVCVLTFFVIGESVSGHYAYLGALIISIWLFPVLFIIMGVIYLILKMKKEGGIMLIIGGSLLLFGFITCGRL